MKNKELITILASLDPELEVVLHGHPDGEGYSDAISVEVISLADVSGHGNWEGRYQPDDCVWVKNLRNDAYNIPSLKAIYID